VTRVSFQHKGVLLQVLGLLLYGASQIFERQEIDVVDRFGDDGISWLRVLDNLAQLVRVEPNHPTIRVTKDSYLFCAYESLRNDDRT
jgi:hypothetical protein